MAATTLSLLSLTALDAIPTMFIGLKPVPISASTEI